MYTVQCPPPPIGKVRFNRDLRNGQYAPRTTARECGTTDKKKPISIPRQQQRQQYTYVCIIIRGRIWKRFGAEARMSASAAMCNRQFALN
jgi:hypothetical protein